MQPAPGPAFWPGFIPLQHNLAITIVQLTVHCRHILGSNQCLSVAVCFQIRRYAARALPVPVRRSLQCSLGVEFGSKRFTNRVQTYRCRLHQRERRPRLHPPGRRLLAGFICIDHRWLLAGWSWGLVVPFPELALEVVYVGLVGELVHWCSCLRRRGIPTPLEEGRRH